MIILQKKKFMGLLLIFNMLILTLSPVSALASSTNNIDPFQGYYISYDEKSNMTGYNMPTSLKDTRVTDTKMVPTLLKTGSKSNYDNGFHPSTNAWRRVSSYGFSTSKTVSVGISFSASGANISGNISVSNTVASGFSFTISADQSRDSKLKVNTDFNYKYYRGDVYDLYSGAFIYSFNYSVIDKTAERFIPYYK